MTASYRPIAACRIGGGSNLLPVLDLGHQSLTGVFPRRVDDPVTRGPLQLARCPESGLPQLAHSYDPAEMYGDNYGYRSDLNGSMVRHVTHGTHIPIISEAEARAMNPDYFLVLPWHFKEGILQREAEFPAGGGRVIFPFPEIEIV